MKKVEEILGEYILVESLGREGLGFTFFCHHKLTKRPFLLTLLPEYLSADVEFISRLEKQVEKLAKLEHPHLLKLHTVSKQDSSYYLVFELPGDVSCTTLKHFLTTRSLTEEESLSLLQDVASALDYMHAQHIFHGAVKLSNLLVAEGKEGLHLFVKNGGLSTIIGEIPLLTQLYKTTCEELEAKESHPIFLEDFSFLAPEYKKVDPLELDHKVDAYAFGILTYFLLFGEFPELSCELPSQHGGFKYNWDPLITECLEKAPARRPTALIPLIDRLGSARDVKLPEQGAIYGFPLKPVLRPSELKRPSFEPDPGAIFQTETVVGAYKPAPKKDKVIDPMATEMVVLKEGHYLRGSNTGCRDELSRHAVFLDAFAIDIHPVSNEQFVCFLEVMGGEKDGNNNDMIRLRDSRIKRAGGKISIESGYSKHPVVGVSWYGAVAYAKWVGKRLPTEAEWEVASYGGKEDALYPTGQEIDRSQANFFSSDTTPVMSYPPNGLGLYDMAGNVYEWCEDWYDHHYYDLSVQEPHNPKGPLQGVYRVLRGGCWKSLKEDLRCSHRNRNNPGVMNGTYGFRCAADVT